MAFPHWPRQTVADDPGPSSFAARAPMGREIRRSAALSRGQVQKLYFRTVRAGRRQTTQRPSDGAAGALDGS